MDKVTRELIEKFLKQYADVLDNEGCNDFNIKDTTENRKFMQAVNAWYNEEILRLYNGEILGKENMVARYLIYTIKNS